MIKVDISDNIMKTYSDCGYMIERDGVLYIDASDPVDSGREYTETNIPTGVGDELTAEQALAIITGEEAQA